MRLSFRMDVPADFDLARTVYSHGFHQIPPFTWDPRASRLAMALRPSMMQPPPPGSGGRLPGGTPVLVSLSGGARGADPLRVRIHAPRRRSRTLLTRFVRAVLMHVLDLERDMSGFHRLCRSYAPLSWVPRAGAGRILRMPDVFADVVVSICGTNTTWKQAVRSVHRICDIAPASPSGGPRCFPTASEILHAGPSHLLEHARVGYRNRSILQFCLQVCEGRVNMRTPLDPSVDGPGLRHFFRSLPGIGPVTARYLATVHGRTDELAVDSLVLRYIGDKYHGGRRPTERAVQRRYASFGPHRSLAYWFEFLGDVDPVTWRGW